MTRGKPAPGLRGLDDRFVPSMQRRTRRLVAAVSAPAVVAHRFEQRLAGGALYRFGWRRRAVVRTVVVAIAMAGSAVHLQRYPDVLQRREAERAAALQQTISRPDLASIGELPAGAGIIGPPVGQPPAPYIAERTQALASLDAGRHVAIVSLASYVGAREVLALLPETAVVQRAQYRMPDARATPLETEVVAGDLAASIDRIVSDEVRLLEDEERSQQELLDSGTIQSEEFERDARNRVDEIRTVRNVLLATGGIVFAVVVEADAAVLRDLSRNDVVRLVDVLPADVDPATSVLFGLKPDDLTRVTFGVPTRR